MLPMIRMFCNPPSQLADLYDFALQLSLFRRPRPCLVNKSVLRIAPMGTCKAMVLWRHYEQKNPRKSCLQLTQLVMETFIHMYADSYALLMYLMLRQLLQVRIHWMKFLVFTLVLLRARSLEAMCAVIYFCFDGFSRNGTHYIQIHTYGYIRYHTRPYVQYRYVNLT